MRRPREGLPLLAVAVVGILLAGGSYLVVDGQNLEVGGKIRLPFFYLNRLLGRIGEPINFPVRFLATTSVALAAAASLAARDKWGPWIGAAAVVVLLDVQFNQLISRPLPTLQPWSYEVMEQLPEERAPTVDLSLAWRADREVRWAVLSAQMVHGQQLQGVPLERIEFFARDGHDFVANLPLVQGLAPAYAHHQPQLEGVDARADLALLWDVGFRRVQVLGVGQDRRISPVMKAEMIRILGDPLVYSEFCMVWAIPEPDATDDELRTWREEHAKRLSATGSESMGPQLR